MAVKISNLLTLKLTLYKEDTKAWTGLNQFKIRTNSGQSNTHFLTTKKIKQFGRDEKSK
jgi:hypothetical protein